MLAGAVADRVGGQVQVHRPSVDWSNRIGHNWPFERVQFDATLGT